MATNVVLSVNIEDEKSEISGGVLVSLKALVDKKLPILYLSFLVERKKFFGVNKYNNCVCFNQSHPLLIGSNSTC